MPLFHGKAPSGSLTVVSKLGFHCKAEYEKTAGPNAYSLNKGSPWLILKP
jgi:hypothetical protein